MTKKNEIQEMENYALVNMEQENLKELIEMNIGEGGMSRFDLDKVKVPAGGLTVWSIPDLEEGEKNDKELTGVIIYWKEVRAYWKSEYDGSQNPPDCYSDDAVLGVGDPGGVCAKCPFAQFGSAEKGDGQACKQMRILFMVRESDILPITITAPPTSVGNIKKYFMRLASKGIMFYGVKTTLKLEKTKSNSGIDYSVIVPEFAGKLSPDEKKAIKNYQEMIKPMLDEVRIESGDYVESEK